MKSIAIFLVVLLGATVYGHVWQQRGGLTVVSGTGSNSEELQPFVEGFKQLIGGQDNLVGGSFKTGFRTINWDGVPQQFSIPNELPNDFFNRNSPRGIVFVEDRKEGEGFLVSNNEGQGNINFGELDLSYETSFSTFSPQKLFTPKNSNKMRVRFFVPNTTTEAVTSGFGVVFSSVNTQFTTTLTLYDEHGQLLGLPFSALTSPTPSGLSFLGIHVRGDSKIAFVDLVTGNSALGSSVVDEPPCVDVVVMDDFIFGEPLTSRD